MSYHHLLLTSHAAACLVLCLALSASDGKGRRCGLLRARHSDLALAYCSLLCTGVYAWGGAPSVATLAAGLLLCRTSLPLERLRAVAAVQRLPSLLAAAFLSATVRHPLLLDRRPAAAAAARRSPCP